MGAVDHPGHYRADTGHEAIDVIEAWGLGFNLGNAVKYIARNGRKGDALEDLRKARWYLDREIQTREASEAPAKPMPMNAMRYAVECGGRPDILEVSATKGFVRIAYPNSGGLLLTPDQAYWLAESVPDE